MSPTELKEDWDRIMKITAMEQAFNALIAQKDALIEQKEMQIAYLKIQLIAARSKSASQAATPTS